MKTREKELKQLIYLRSELIKQYKKEIKKYHDELREIQGYKNLERRKKNKSKMYKYNV